MTEGVHEPQATASQIGLGDECNPPMSEIAPGGIDLNDQLIQSMLSKDSNHCVDETSTPIRKAPTLATMSARQYLDATVVPLLLEGLALLAKERPLDPVDYLAQYLINNKDKATQTDQME